MHIKVLAFEGLTILFKPDLRTLKKTNTSFTKNAQGKYTSCVYFLIVFPPFSWKPKNGTSRLSWFSFQIARDLQLTLVTPVKATD